MVFLNIIFNDKDILRYFIQWDILYFAYIWFVKKIKNGTENILHFNV